ncbi:MAG: hypothetical protein AB1726_01110, partial [Planctomycetota bacterium]
LRPAAAAGALRGELRPSLALLLGLLAIVAASELAFATRVGPAPGEAAMAVLAWPWYIPAGSVVAFVLGLLLAKPRPA